MDFVKVYETTDMNFSLPQNYEPKSNHCNVDISFSTQTNKISFNGQDYGVPDINFCYFKTFKIYSVSDMHHILTLNNHNFFEPIIYVITLNENPVFKIIRGKILYITKTGLIVRYHWLENEIRHTHYNVINSKWDNPFVRDETPSLKYYKYMILSTTEDKIEIHVPIKAWIDDFQEHNPDLCVEEYFFKTQPSEVRCAQEEFLVHFKNCTKNISSVELLALQSEFVNEQFSQGEIYFDSFSYQEYFELSQNFLVFINSYLLHTNLKKKMIKLFT